MSACDVVVGVLIQRLDVSRCHIISSHSANIGVPSVGGANALDDSHTYAPKLSCAVPAKKHPGARLLRWSVNGKLLSIPSRPAAIMQTQNRRRFPSQARRQRLLCTQQMCLLFFPRVFLDVACTTSTKYSTRWHLYWRCSCTRLNTLVKLLFGHLSVTATTALPLFIHGPECIDKKFVCIVFAAI